MYPLVLFVLSLLIFGVLLQINGLIALIFLLGSMIVIPAIVMHRREMATAPEIGPDAESTAMGALRLAGNLGIDATGVALGVGLLLLLGLSLALLVTHHGIH